ncbi:longitudinals lacking protein, isoforms A/B/D/L-like [Thrips palmi]|uniref:Longitudinals lacking protein, isoforms A/B/D/L-like n=1 Tax=Thrips palmi TaxID=161013 RepID=A0A6P8ZZM0_THRPL|nr:longitudinals lacking protein, isoforms A/B/D/L-like [Thrips palmi]
MAVDEELLMSQDQTIIITTLNTEELSMLDGAPTTLGLGGRQMYRCNKCDRAYYHTQSLMRHRKVECGKQPQVSCPHCPYRCKQKADMKKHINRDAGDADWYREAYRQGLESGLHGLGAEPDPGAEFGAELGAELMPGTEPSADSRFVCSSCLKRYRDYNSLWKHVKFVCGNSFARYQCPLCMVRCKRRDTMRRHMLMFDFVHGDFVMCLLS